jgi:lysophospholipid acyltransferase (LPLAT)-like uncharacterized protein
MRISRNSRFHGLALATAGVLGAGLLRGLGATWRFTTIGTDPLRGDDPFIPAIWHRGLFVGAVFMRDLGATVPISLSRDGDWIDAVLQRMGFAEAARGSSSKAATTLLRSLIRQVRRGGLVAMLPDGPRGPACDAKPGVVALARATQVPLLPVGVATDRCWEFGSWDRTVLPKPFARVVLRYGDPHEVPKRAGNEEIESLRKELGAAMNRLDAEAVQALAASSAQGRLEDSER